MRTITFFGDRTNSTFLIISSVSRTKDNLVSRTDNFVNVNVFNSATSSRVLSYRKWKLCKERRIINYFKNYS